MAAFSYRVFSESPPSAATSPLSGGFSTLSELQRNVPILLKPIWKPQGDKIDLLVQYGPNPACTLPGPVTLHNVAITAFYLGDKGVRVTTRPGGTHFAEKGLVNWHLGDLTVDPVLGVGKVLCRVFGSTSGALELRPGHVEMRWEFSPAPVAAGTTATATALASGISISRLAERDDGTGEVESELEHDDNENKPDLEDPFADAGPATPATTLLPEGKQWVDVPLARKLVSGKDEAAEVGQMPGTSAAGSSAPVSPDSAAPA